LLRPWKRGNWSSVALVWRIFWYRYIKKHKAEWTYGTFGGATKTCWQCYGHQPMTALEREQRFPRAKDAA
jgi:hypothetical protein